MSSKFLAPDGTITPRMFIGIGGVGSRIVDRIAERAQHLPNWKEQLKDLTTFISIDTNELDQNRLEAVPPGNRLNIAAFDKSKAIDNFRRSEDPQALHWIDRGYAPRQGIKPGAGQIRIESRLGFFYNSPDIRQRLRERVSATLVSKNSALQVNPPKYDVYIYCSLAGGTGSGAFLSVAYLIDALVRDHQWQPRIVGNLLLSSLMTTKVKPELHPDIHANTYAALKELEHLTKLDYQQVRDEGRQDEPFVYWRNPNSNEIPTVGTRPFFLGFVHDRPAHTHLPDPEAAIADASFLQVFTPIINDLSSEFDNYEKEQVYLTQFPGELKQVGQGYTKNFGAFGAIGLYFPGKDFLQYCALRFAAESVRSQITFGVDRSDPSDERAVALARLAVDYNDPRFQAMSLEGREEALNEAFARSVSEMARQDEAQDLTDGYWYRLKQSTDDGAVTGTDGQGQPLRAESLVGRVRRTLDEQLRTLINQLKIRERSFEPLQREGVGQYLEYVGTLKEDLRVAQQTVDAGMPDLLEAARTGEAVASLRLDPIGERYLVLRLLEQVQQEWLPGLETAVEKARKGSIENPKVKERLEQEEYESLSEAANSKRLFNREQPFLEARDGAQNHYLKTLRQSRTAIETAAQIRQVQALLDYLRERSRQYSNLATRMDGLVSDLERDAERLRLREAAVVRPLALGLEVLASMEAGRERMWDRAYKQLFLSQGQYLVTFDRDVISTAITKQLQPVVRGDGRVESKGNEETVTDVREAMIALGHERMQDRVMGGGMHPGLGLPEALNLEAQIALTPARPSGERLAPSEVDAYVDRKLRALAQLAGCFCRLESTEAQSLGDGVKVARMRLLAVANDPTGRSDAFQQKLVSILQTGNYVPTIVKGWSDPQLAIVHDAELSIPMYYISPVVSDIQDAYISLAANDRRPYNLHTDYRWEKSLPNLDPRRAEITVGWAMTAVVEGLVAGIIKQEAQGWTWAVGGSGGNQLLGDQLSSATYRLGEIHRKKELRNNFEGQLEEALGGMTPEQIQERRAVLAKRLEDWLLNLGLGELDGALSREDALDRPVVKVLIAELKKDHVPSAGGRGRVRLDLELD